MIQANYKEKWRFTWNNFWFREGFSQWICTASLIFNCVRVVAWSMTTKHSLEQSVLHLGESCKCLKFWCAGWGACYVGESSRHICTLINEHLNVIRLSHFQKIFTKLLLLRPLENVILVIKCKKYLKNVYCVFCCIILCCLCLSSLDEVI